MNVWDLNPWQASPKTGRLVVSPLNLTGLRRFIQLDIYFCILKNVSLGSTVTLNDSFWQISHPQWDLVGGILISLCRQLIIPLTNLFFAWLAISLNSTYSYKLFTIVLLVLGFFCITVISNIVLSLKATEQSSLNNSL